MLVQAMALMLSLAQAGPLSFDPARVEAARANYEAIIQGRKFPHQFNRQELGDVLAIADALHQGRRLGTRSERCVADEKRRTRGNPSALEMRVIDMKCREPGEKLK